MIPTYNGTKYLGETLRSVLAQDPGPEHMTIEVVDDCSTEGDIARLVHEIGGERVTYFRQPVNRGYIANFATCIERSRGHIVHLLHDDDAVRQGFYERLGAGLATRPDAGAAFCRSIYVDPNGHWDSFTALERPEPGVLDNWLWKIATGPRLTTPSLVVRRKVYETLGAYDERQRFAGEDWEMWVRIATRYPVWYEPVPLALYRVRREGSLTSRSSATGDIAVEMRRAAEIIETYLPDHLPPASAARMTNFARREFARWSTDAAVQLLEAGRPAEAIKRVREAWRASPNPQVPAALLAGTARAGVRIGVRAQRRAVARARAALKRRA
jgi:glycosyltransferase involved in cell wall biosynthesis